MTVLVQLGPGNVPTAQNDFTLRFALFRVGGHLPGDAWLSLRFSSQNAVAFWPEVPRHYSPLSVVSELHLLCIMNLNMLRATPSDMR